MTDAINTFSEAIAGPMDSVAAQLKALASEHQTANTNMRSQAHNLTTSFKGLAGTAFTKMVDNQYRYTDGIIQKIDEMAGYISTAAGWIRDAAHFATMLIQPFADLVEEVIHRLSPDLVLREGESAVWAIIHDIEGALQDMLHSGGSFFGDLFHLNFGGALHDLVQEGKDIGRLAGDALAMLSQVGDIMARWAAKLFEAVNWCINQVNSVVYHITDWVFGLSDIANDAAILSDPNATPEEKAMAGTMMGVTALLDVAMLIPGADIFAAGGKLAGKGAMALLEKLGLDEMAKMLANKIADSVAATVVKEIADNTLNTAKKGLEQVVEQLADKGVINSLTKDQILSTIGHLLGPDAAKTLDALSPEGKQFVEKYAQMVNGISDFEDSSLRNATADQRAAFFKAQQQAWFSQLTNEEKAAIKAYTGDDWYKAINTYARTGKVLPGFSETELQQFIQHLNPAFKDAIIPADTVAQRVVGPNMLDLFKEGTLFQDGGFVSTSIDPQHSWKNSIRLFIKLPEGAPGAFVKDLSVYPNEFEVLLPRNSVMQVEHVIDLHKLALSAADQELLKGFPEYIIELKYVGIAK